MANHTRRITRLAQIRTHFTHRINRIVSTRSTTSVLRVHHMRQIRRLLYLTHVNVLHPRRRTVHVNNITNRHLIRTMTGSFTHDSLNSLERRIRDLLSNSTMLTNRMISHQLKLNANNQIRLRNTIRGLSINRPAHLSNPT